MTWLIWRFNPSFDALPLATPLGDISLPSMEGRTLSDYFSRFRTSAESAPTAKRKPRKNIDTDADSPASEDGKPATLRPRNPEDQFLVPDEATLITDMAPKPSLPSQERSSELQLELPETMVGEPSIKDAKPFEKISLETFGFKSKKTDVESDLLDNALEIAPEGEKINQELRIEEQNEGEDDLPFDPTLELSKYTSPTFDLLEEYADQKVEIDREELEANKDQIIRSLLNFKIEIIKIRATIGPTCLLYTSPSPGDQRGSRMPSSA